MMNSSKSKSVSRDQILPGIEEKESKETKENSPVASKENLLSEEILPQHYTVTSWASIMPKTRKTNILIWDDLQLETIEAINSTISAIGIKKILADAFGLDGSSLKDEIIIDLYFNTIIFAKEQNMTCEQMSCLVSITKKTFEVAVETPYINFDSTFKFFKDLLLCHSVMRPPWSIELFSPKEVRNILEYTIKTFFGHFKLYKYAFTAQLHLHATVTYSDGVRDPPLFHVTSAEVHHQVTDETGQADIHGGGTLNKSVSQILEEELSEEHSDALTQLKTMVKNYLLDETIKIEGNMEQRMKAAAQELMRKFYNLTGEELNFTLDNKKSPRNMSKKYAK